jgi:hypothetical protein
MQLLRLSAVGVLVIGLACGDSSAPVVPTGLVIASGNNQSAMPGQALALPLRVTVTIAGGQPFVGGSVRWEVASGSASVTPVTSTTNASGEATTTVNIGTNPGNVSITANVTGVTPVTFTATVLDPCDTLTPLGTTPVAGALSAFDCVFPTGFFTDFYQLDMPAQAGVLVTMTSSAFDTYLEMYHLSTPFLGVNDDLSADSTNSRLIAILPQGSYVIGASSYDQNRTGAYTLTQTGGNQALTGCDPYAGHLKWITRGLTLTEQIQTTDCLPRRAVFGSTATDTSWGDHVLITLSPQRAISATLASAAFEPRLELYQLSNLQAGTPPPLVASQSGSGGSASITYTPPGTGALSTIYLLVMRPVTIGGTGAYTLTVGGPLPGEASLREMVAPGMWSAPARMPKR